MSTKFALGCRLCGVASTTALFLMTAAANSKDADPFYHGLDIFKEATAAAKEYVDVNVIPYPTERAAVAACPIILIILKIVSWADGINLPAMAFKANTGNTKIVNPMTPLSGL